MGLRGPGPTPTSISKARCSRVANARRREPRSGEPPCPTWLNKDERKIWKAVVPVLLDMNVLTIVDGFALERYCDAVPGSAGLVVDDQTIFAQQSIDQG